MERRNFIRTSTLGSTAIVSGASFKLQSQANTFKPHVFNLNYAPHIGMFKNSAGENPLDQLQFMAEQGFKSWEDNGMPGREIGLQNQMASSMEKLGLEMGVFVAHKIYWKEPTLTTGDKAIREEFLTDIKNSIEVAKRVNAKWMTVVPGHVDLKLPMGYQTANVLESLKQASALLEPHNLTMVLEPLNFRNHPGLFLTDSPQAFELCKAVDSPACKILFDIYHQQIQEGNLIPNIESCWEEIAYFQIGDNPGRKEPTTGEINYKNVFKYIYDKGYKGILGMEHGNSRPDKEGELAVINAYKEVDNFI
ncbi:hydroxypyruvate isomerase family protein [Eudoraea chungangensis]|uniref:hydroxypyruvate isomerase family protein n=1 Tax=Eudoraea chungangensis TaxID=1481905 RepID=UPI0023EB5129|nr:TIM barrel protein [Eudoraea chungangensis]